MTNCRYCGEKLGPHNVYMWNKRKDIVDCCESCADRLERGEDMYP